MRNWYGVSSNTSGPVKSTSLSYENYYWIAVGPKVIYDDYPDTGNPGQDTLCDENGQLKYPFYGEGTIDALLKDDEGNLLYLRCIPGDVKAHTWNNGIIQSWHVYPSDGNPDIDDSIVGNSYNGKVCVEFLGSVNYSGLNALSINKLFFYNNRVTKPET